MKKSKFSAPTIKIEEFEFPQTHLPPLPNSKSRKTSIYSSKKHLKSSSYGLAKTETNHNDVADNTINNISYITPKMAEKGFSNFRKRIVKSPLRRLNEFKKKKKIEDSINITLNTLNTSENYSNLNTSAEKTKVFLRERNAERILERNSFFLIFLFILFDSIKKIYMFFRID